MKTPEQYEAEIQELKIQLEEQKLYVCTLLDKIDDLKTEYWELSNQD